MSGSDEEGDYTLDIDHVTLEDDAMFQCQVGAAPGVAPVRSRYAMLTVTVRPEPPSITHGDSLHTQEDRVISLECVSRGGKPAAEVSTNDAANAPPRIWWWYFIDSTEAASGQAGAVRHTFQ